MLKVKTTNSFKKDLKRINKRNLNLNKLRNTIEALTAQQSHPKSLRDHHLKGAYTNHRECHIEPDWLLIYKKTATHIILERTGIFSNHGLLYDILQGHVVV